MHSVITIILAIIVVLSIALGRTYQFIPVTELKRRARSGNKLAKSLYKVASYRSSAQFVLWAIAIFASSAFFIMLAKRSPYWVAFVSGATLIWVAYVWIPRSAINVIFEYMAQVLASPFAWLLQYLNPPIEYVLRKLDIKRNKHTNIFDKEDMRELFVLQQQQDDNRIDKLELEMLKRVLFFSDHQVKDIMIAKRKVESVSVSDSLSPVILDELHATGHLFFPVHEGKTTNVVGVIDISKAIHLNHTVSVREVMDDKLVYVHEEDTLVDLMHKLLNVHQPLMIVLNNLEEYVGVVSVKDLITELVGPEVVDELEVFEVGEDAVETHETDHTGSKNDNELIE